MRSAPNHCDSLGQSHDWAFGETGAAWTTKGDGMDWGREQLRSWTQQSITCAFVHSGFHEVTH